MASRKLLGSIAENVRRHRKANGWTQGDLAKRIGVHLTRISELERGLGDPTVGTIERVASALGVAPVALVADAEAPAAV